MEKIEVGDTVRVKAGCWKGHEAQVVEIKSVSARLWIDGRNDREMLESIRNLDLIRKARKPVDPCEKCTMKHDILYCRNAYSCCPHWRPSKEKKEEPTMKCEDCANFKAKEWNPGDWVEVVEPNGGHSAGTRGQITRPFLGLGGVWGVRANGKERWERHLISCSPPSPVTITIPDLKAALREKYGDEIIIDLAGKKLTL